MLSLLVYSIILPSQRHIYCCWCLKVHTKWTCLVYLHHCTRFISYLPTHLHLLATFQVNLSQPVPPQTRFPSFTCCGRPNGDKWHRYFCRLHMSFLQPIQQCQSTEGNTQHWSQPVWPGLIFFSSTVGLEREGTLLPLRCLQCQYQKFILLHYITLSLQGVLQQWLDAAYSYRQSCMVCLSACLLVTFVSPAKTAEPIEMPIVG